MRTVWYSRRSWIATISVLGMVVLGIHNNIDVSMALASIAIGVAASNAYESKAPAVIKKD